MGLPPIYDARAFEERRRRAIEMITAGERQADVARTLGVTPAAVCIWWSNYRKKGDRALVRKSRPGRPPEIKRSLLNRLPRLLHRGALSFGYQSDIWTTDRVAEVIEREFGYRYHRDHVCRILHQLGLTWQRPTRRAFERNEEAIRDWVEHRWTAIKKKPAVSTRRSPSRTSRASR